MPNTTLAANAAAMPIDRRTALRSLAAAGALLAVPKIARPASPDALSTLIAAHAKAHEAFLQSIDEKEAAEPADDARVVGMLGAEYSLGEGKERIVGYIRYHFRSKSNDVARIALICPAYTTDALASLERDRDAALARLDAAFAAADAAGVRYRERNVAEVVSLFAVATHRCSTDDERSRKARYLWTYREATGEAELIEALLRSSMPEGEV